MTHSNQLHPQHIAALRTVREGVDVFAYDTARLLREARDRRPKLVEIGEPFGTYPEDAARPYFGAILTPAGRALIDAEVAA